MITIVDYGLGNIQAFVNTYKRLGFEVRCARDAGGLVGATKLILPGVGAFDHAMQLLNSSGMRPDLEELVQARQVPVLGICVGMQILAHSSDEGKLPGLGWVHGRVKNFKSDKHSADLPLPHMGWNDVKPVAGTGLFAGLEVGARFYFLHSYFFDCANADSVEAFAHYGRDFACAVRSNNVHGVQFHPEKSHHCGTTLLKNFAES